MARPKSAATRLDEALAAAETAKRKLAELHAARNKALLADDDVTALKLAAEIDLQGQSVRGLADKIELLKSEAEREAAERRSRERAALIKKIEGQLAQRDEVGRELAETIAKADALFRQLFDIAKQIRAEWPWERFHFDPCLIGENVIITAVQHELYRVGARPVVGGGMDKPGGGLNFPGGKSPTLQLQLQPDRITPLVEALKEASRVASEVMRHGTASGVTPVTSVPIPAEFGGPQRERTDAEQRLAKLLNEAYAASSDVSPAGEAKYEAIMAQVKATQIEIDEFASLAANGGSR